ncbi:hypothetical protein ACFOEP_12665 [Microbacterium amylolyticum]|uniref:DUF7134 domain-containing protein n=1 Tax=Microbacterium amylolyticum TaxID=936337 RepID=UPI00360CEAAF
MAVIDTPLPRAASSFRSEAEDLAREAPTPAELRNDWFLGGGLVVAVVISDVLSFIAGYGSFDEEQSLPLMLLFSLLMTLPLVMRRRFPITVALIVNAAYIVGAELNAIEYYVSQIALFCSIYTIGAWVNDRRRAMRGAH